MKRKIWWELIFVSVLLYLFIEMRAEKKHEVAAAARITLAATVEQETLNPIVAVAQAVIAPALQLGALVPTPVAPLVLQ